MWFIVIFSRNINMLQIWWDSWTAYLYTSSLPSSKWFNQLNKTPHTAVIIDFEEINQTVPEVSDNHLIYNLFKQDGVSESTDAWRLQPLICSLQVIRLQNCSCLDISAEVWLKESATFDIDFHHDNGFAFSNIMDFETKNHHIIQTKEPGEREWSCRKNMHPLTLD